MSSEPLRMAQAVCLPALIILICGVAACGAEAPLVFEKDIQPVLATYCYPCHGPEKKKGDLELSKFKTTASLAEGGEIWETMTERLRAREMPPGKAKLPLKEEDRHKLLAWLDKLPKVEIDCHKVANDENQNFYRGYVMSRRLSRAEYNNTVRDLFGLKVNLADMFPADGSGGEGFNNNGDTLFISSIQMEKYLAAADKILDRLLPEHGNTKGLGSDASAARSRLLSLIPADGVSSHEAAKRILASVMRRAFRRPVTPAEIERHLTMFDRAHSRGDGFEASLKLALKSVLVSPNFLFLVEPEPEKDGVYRLGDHPLAARLSYFIWASMPDEELSALADAGQLHQPEILKAQTRRMIRDPRVQGMAETFACQWLGLEGLNGAVKPDSTRFPEFDYDLADAMRAEAVTFFDHLIREDRSLLELIDSDYTFANRRLGALYGIDAHGDEMQRVALKDSSRGGVIGMAAVLTATSYPLRTSPVLRGKWVLESILGTKVPPPPPDAGQLPPDDVQPDKVSFRKRLEKHRTRAECAVCHQRMDPLGFGLENFDPIGRWRTQQGGEAVDASGELPNGAKFNGPAELKKMLLNRKDEFLRNLSQKMLGYALGRGLTKFDFCVVNDSMKALAANNYRASVLIEQIVMSYPFQYRYFKK